MDMSCLMCLYRHVHWRRAGGTAVDILVKMYNVTVEYFINIIKYH